MESNGVERVARIAALARANVERVVVGKGEQIDLIVVALLCGGHVLLEDVPGIGKTVLAKSIARTLDCSFRRIQFTPDLLPSDVTGLSYFNQKEQAFEFRPGPVFTQVLLADEVNRATPRTQSALLEAMEERQVTLEGETRLLPQPFLVLATQNPVELAGTFPLPEAQLDRFLLRVALGYPAEDDERAIVRRFRTDNPLDTLEPVVDAPELMRLQRLCREVHVGEAVEGYLVGIVRATRTHPALELGASPRATLALYRASQAHAAIHGRAYVIPDDVKLLAPSVLAHRVIPRAQARLRGRALDEVVAEIVASAPVPVEDSPIAAPATAGLSAPPGRG
jgi:MoxR-like ATPase